MHRLMHGFDDIIVGLGIAIILSTASTAVYLMLHGCKSVKHALTAWCVGCFSGVLAHWACQHLGIEGAFSALLISMASLLSHAFVVDVLFHPQLRRALLKRLTVEIHTRGRRRDH